MARVLVSSPEAIEDIEAIATYIERDSPWYAMGTLKSNCAFETDAVQRYALHGAAQRGRCIWV